MACFWGKTKDCTQVCGSDTSYRLLRLSGSGETEFSATPSGFVIEYWDGATVGIRVMNAGARLVPQPELNYIWVPTSPGDVLPEITLFPASFTEITTNNVNLYVWQGGILTFPDARVIISFGGGLYGSISASKY